MVYTYDNQDYLESEETLEEQLRKLRRSFTHAGERDRLRAEQDERTANAVFQRQYGEQLNDATRYVQEARTFIQKGEFGAAEDRLEMRGIAGVVLAPIREQLLGLRQDLYSRLFRALLHVHRYDDIIRLDDYLEQEYLHTHSTYFALAVAYEETFDFFAASEAISEAIIAKPGQPIYLIRAAHIAMNCVWHHAVTMSKQQQEKEPLHVLSDTDAKLQKAQGLVIDNLTGAWKLASGDSHLIAHMEDIYAQLMETDLFHKVDSSPLRLRGFFDRTSVQPAHLPTGSTSVKPAHLHLPTGRRRK